MEELVPFLKAFPGHLFCTAAVFYLYKQNAKLQAELKTQHDFINELLKKELDNV